MQAYGSPIEILETAFDRIKDGAEKVEEGFNYLKGLDWEEILEALSPEDREEVMELINEGLDQIENGLYDIND